MSQSLGGASGQCQVCGNTFRVVASTGVLRKHGWGNSNPACIGSGKPPVGVPQPLPEALLNDSRDLFDSSTSGQLPCSSVKAAPPFAFVSFKGVILKRLPKGTRAFAATVFNSCIRQLLSDGSNPTRWQRLFQFPTCFAQPPRGGKKHN